MAKQVDLFFNFGPYTWLADSAPAQTGEARRQLSNHVPATDVEPDGSVDEGPRTHGTAVNATWKSTPTRFVNAGSVRFAYRELGPQTGVPLVFLHHLTAVLDDWDPMV